MSPVEQLLAEMIDTSSKFKDLRGINLSWIINVDLFEELVDQFPVFPVVDFPQTKLLSYPIKISREVPGWHLVVARGDLADR